MWSFAPNKYTGFLVYSIRAETMGKIFGQQIGMPLILPHKHFFGLPSSHVTQSRVYAVSNAYMQTHSTMRNTHTHTRHVYIMARYNILHKFITLKKKMQMPPMAAAFKGVGKNSSSHLPHAFPTVFNLILLFHKIIA